MSDGLDITHGGAISVDPDAMRAVAEGMRGLGPGLIGAMDSIRRAYRILVDAPGLSAGIDTVALWASVDAVDALHGECLDAAEGTALMADAFELVELRAQREALTVADTAAADALHARIAALEGSEQPVSEMATYLVAGWKGERFDGLDGQFDLSGLLGPDGLAPVFAGAAMLGAFGGLGVVRGGTILGGTVGQVTVTPIRTASVAAPPASLADAFRRFPSAEGAQLRIERYTMADGSHRFVVYTKGTQSPLFGGANPFDMKSNVELYTKQQADSYQGTLDALSAAGARPGDQVDVYAHSQGGMTAAHLAMQSEFDVKVQVTAGSPVQPTLSDDQLLIQLRHTDDLVNALAGGGSPEGTGSPDSFTASRVGDPVRLPHDLMLKTHMIETYIETAEMVDASGDVRLHAIEDSWRELAEAVEIESTEYRVARE